MTGVGDEVKPMRLLTSRSEARAAGSTRYFTGKPCPHGHVAERMVSDRQCVVCRRLRKAPGGSQRHNKLKRNKKWRQQSQSPAAQACRFAMRLRDRLWEAIRGKVKSGSAVADLGCTVAEARAYLEALFQPGMTWENYGEWHIDHIRPLSSFSDLEDRDQLLQAVHYTNLQPLWAKDNIAKGSKWQEAA